MVSSDFSCQVGWRHVASHELQQKPSKVIYYFSPLIKGFQTLVSMDSTHLAQILVNIFSTAPSIIQVILYRVTLELTRDFQADNVSSLSEYSVLQSICGHKKWIILEGFSYFFP